MGRLKAIDKPIPNVKVMLIVEKDGIINDVTDPTGQFFFENVPIGMHLFEVLGGHDAVQYSKRVPVILDQPFVNMHIIQIGVEVPMYLIKVPYKGNKEEVC